MCKNQCKVQTQLLHLYHEFHHDVRVITAVRGPIRQASAKAKSGSWQTLWAELDKSPLDSLGLRETAYGTIRIWTRMVRVVPENHNTTPGGDYDHDHNDPEYLCHPPTLS